jgi:hypothetical protein
MGQRVFMNFCLSELWENIQLAHLSELWQEVHARRTPGREEVDKDRLATRYDIREIPGSKRAQSARLYRQSRKCRNILHQVTVPINQ